MTLLAIVTAIEKASIAVSDVCKVLLSPEGQAAMKQWREDGQELRRVLNAIGSWFDRVGSLAFGIDSSGKVSATVKTNK